MKEQSPRLSRVNSGRSSSLLKAEEPSSPPPIKPDEVSFVLQQHREEMDKMKKQAEKLKEQVKTAFQKVKIEVSQMKEGIDQD